MNRRYRTILGFLAMGALVALVLLAVFAGPPRKAPVPRRVIGWASLPDDGRYSDKTRPARSPESALLEPPGEDVPAVSTGKRPPLAPPRAVSVKFSAGSSLAQRKAVLDKHGFRLLQDIPSIGWVSAEPKSAKADVGALLREVQQDPNVAFAERQSWAYADLTPDDPYFPNQWGFYNNGSLTGSSAGADGKISPAWDWARGDGTVIAVVDTGIDFSHPDLAGKMHPASWDYVYNDATVYHAADGDKHGTHVAGTAAAFTNNGVGGSGTAPGARIMSLKFLGAWDNGLVANGAAGITRAVDNGADVINCSWGTTTFSQALADAVSYAASKGVIVVAASGNSAVNIDSSLAYPASLTSTNVVTVASTTFSDGISSYSNYGATSVDLGAPGQYIVSTQPIKEGALFIDCSPYKIEYLSFPLESVGVAADRVTVIQRCLTGLGTTAKNSPILVVDDSWPGYTSEIAGARLGRYTTALSSAGYNNVTTYSVQANLAPPSASAMASKTVIWFTGAATLRWATAATALSSSDRTQLTTFLNGGGKMLLSSADAGFDCAYIGFGAATFYNTYLHSVFCGDDSWAPDLIGRPGSIFDALNMTISDKASFDCILPRDAYATSAGHWPEYGEASGTSMAAPHVTGTLALMYSKAPTLTATAAKARLLATADPIPALTGKCTTGARLDAAGAVGVLASPAPLLVGPAGPGSQVLYWSKPDDPALAAVKLLSRADTYPAGPSDPLANVIYEGMSESATSTGLMNGQTIHYAAYARNTWGSWSAPARVTTVVVDPPTTGVPVPVGDEVTVTCQGIMATFSNVTQPGWLSVTRISPNYGPPANMFWQSGGYYEIHPVGTVPLPCTLTVPYDPAQAPADLGTLRFFHRAGGSWQDITTGVDSSRHVVTAVTASFSDFGLGSPSGPSDPTQLPLEEPLQGLMLAVGFALAIAIGQRGRKKASA